MKKKSWVILFLSLASILFAGGTYAAFTASTETQHKVNTKNVKIKVHQQGEDKLWIQNVGSEDCYIKVTINRSWYDGEEKEFASDIKPQEIQINSEEGWVISEDAEDSEAIDCYYIHPVPAGEQTTNILHGFTLLEQSQQESSNAYAGLSAKLEFEIDAVQALGGTEAMMAEWGVDIESEEKADRSATGSVSFQGDAKAFVTNVSGDEFTGMVPGEERTLTLSLNNEHSSAIKFYMSAEILDNIAESGDKMAVYDFTIAKNGQVFFTTVIGGEEKYNISTGKDYLTTDNHILLDSLAKGENTELSISLKLDGSSAGNTYQSQQGDFQLKFSVEKAPMAVNQETTDEQKQYKNTIIQRIKTGDALPIGIFVVLTIASMTVILAVLVNNKKNRKRGQS